MAEIDLGLQSYEWNEDGDIADTVCPFCLEVLPDDKDPIEFFEPTECCHACCWRCSYISPGNYWSLCPSCAVDCTDCDLMSWDRSAHSWNGKYENWAVRIFVRDDHKCVGNAVSSGGRSVEVTTPGSVDEIWLALVEQIKVRES